MKGKSAIKLVMKTPEELEAALRVSQIIPLSRLGFCTIPYDPLTDKFEPLKGFWETWAWKLKTGLSVFVFYLRVWTSFPLILEGDIATLIVIASLTCSHFAVLWMDILFYRERFQYATTLNSIRLQLGPLEGPPPSVMGILVGNSKGEKPEKAAEFDLPLRTTALLFMFSLINVIVSCPLEINFMAGGSWGRLPWGYTTLLDMLVLVDSYGRFQFGSSNLACYMTKPLKDLKDQKWRKFFQGHKYE